MMRTYVRRSEHDMKRNAEIGLFTTPSMIKGEKTIMFKENLNKSATQKLDFLRRRQ